MNRKDRRAAKKMGDPIGSPMAATLMSAFRAHQAGYRAEAERLYRDVLAIEPRNAPALHLLGALLHQCGNSREGISLIRQAIAIEPKNADYHYNLGSILYGDGSATDAIEHLSKAITLKPGYAEAHFELGNALAGEGKLEEAEKCLRRALDLQPSNAAATNNLGRVLRAMNRSEEAASLWQRAVTLQPSLAIAHLNIGIVRHEQQRLAEAEESLRRALEIKTDYTDATEALALVLIDQGRSDDALSLVSQSMPTHDTPTMKAIFVRCLVADERFSPKAGLEDLLCRALREAWTWPAELAPYCVSLLKSDPTVEAAIDRIKTQWGKVPVAELLPDREIEAAASKPLFVAYLETTPNIDVDIERFLTVSRASILDRAVHAEAGNVGESYVDFVAALAQQCFINEYVFSEFDEERRRLQRLLTAVGNAIRDRRPLSALQVSALAAYRPLHEIQGAISLLEQSWPASVQALLRRQVEEPLREAALSAGLPALTSFDAKVPAASDDDPRNPSPRWVKANSTGPSLSVPDHLRFRLPEADIPSIVSASAPEILVAGCGTGLSAIDAARSFRDARILAVDASLPDLAYAARQARDLNLQNIEFARADIVQLASIGRTFDVIESSAILDRLADPWAAWSALISLLRTGGIMKVRFRGERIRNEISAVRDVARQGNYQSDVESIRILRHHILRFAPDHPALKVASSGDFYTTGGCRDLVMSQYDHALTLPDIQAFLATNGLAVIGIETSQQTRRAFAARFPDTHARADLAAWHVLERDDPTVMPPICQLWLHKPPVD